MLPEAEVVILEEVQEEVEIQIEDETVTVRKPRI